MYFGRSAGSAQPLVWAHSEYVKLLRSVTDGQVFDRISVVADRYGVPSDQRTFQSRMEIFQVARPISAIMQGGTLRIMDADRFRVVWTTDNWATKNALDSKIVGRPGAYADLSVAADQTGSLVFTLFWPVQDRWLGRNYEVNILTQAPSQAPAAEKPML